MPPDRAFDVAIMGTGLAGTILGAILARHGHEVVMIEKHAHPRFALGESVLPKVSLLMRIIGERYGVREICALRNIRAVCDEIAPTSGTKTTNGFMFHRPERKQDPSEAHLFIPSRTPLGLDSHLYRQDTDLYMLRAAIDHGATYYERTSISDIHFDSRGVEMVASQGRTIRARYVVDATGPGSLLARKLELRQVPNPCRTQSRSIFTHMEGVPRYESTIPAEQHPGLSFNWGDGTIHHVFAGGWFWVIPFDNYEASNNRLCSIGLTLDLRKFPETGLPPEEEFRRVMQRFPSIAAHLGDAAVVRPWVATGRLQYTSTTSVGERFFLMPSAYSFVDPLHSRGLIVTGETINAFAAHLLAALADDDFAPERFAAVDRLQQRMQDFNDRHISNFYDAMAHFPVWSAWLRMHVMFEFLGYMGLVSRYASYIETDDDRLLGDRPGKPFPSATFPNHRVLQDLYDAAEKNLHAYAAQKLSGDAAAEQIFALLSDARCLPPMFDWQRPAYNHVDLSPERVQRVGQWGREVAPSPLSEIFQFDRAAFFDKLRAMEAQRDGGVRGRTAAVLPN